MAQPCTSDGYWTILETVPYSLQNTATNATGTISSVANTQLPVHHHQALHHHHQQQDEGNSSETNLLAGATVVVEIPTETMRNAIKYTIPEAEHQLLHTAESTLATTTTGTKQRIHIVKDMRLNPTVTVAQQTNITATHVEQQSGRQQQSTQQQQQQHFTLNDCLSTGVVVQQRQQTTQQQQTEFIKIDTIQEKMMLRNVIQYEAVDGLPADTSQVISALVESEKNQQQQQQQQQEVLRNTRELELLDKATIEAVSDTVLNAFEQQEAAEHIEEHKSQNHHEAQDKQLLPLMRCPTKILTPAANEAGLQLQYVCNLCGKSYKIKGSLKRHKRYECGVAPTVACQFCPHKCKYKSDLRKHISQKHAGQGGEELLLEQRLSSE
ncbi:longitudinals lacking protein, isoforms N/O/W/X/Y [Zeugodacus cucurbitae]|uniref:longitudinals lacking protein, isoforms N/O/W/X/Y n=1 Tax=Zeugodacus cucurbitae TaxID=28588 RepID=UPI0023D8EAD8|nr:longitudinals lacking protein, isoforms N/O/W/X/Y [Zeugodacus cucurbitae]